MAEFDRSGLLGYFLSEAEDHINTLERGISELETASDSDTLIEDLFRAAHTLKGAAALVKLTTTSNIAHRMEDILEELNEKKRKLSKGLIELLLYMLDAIKGLIQDVAQGRGEDSRVEQEIFTRVDEMMSKEEIAAVPFEVPPVKVPDSSAPSPSGRSARSGS